MPVGKTVKVGVWENEQFRGTVVFSYGANQFHGKAFGLIQQQVCELTRVALGGHVTPVTRILAIAIRMLKNWCPGLRLIVSYADQGEGHHGGIYAGGGWTYVGLFEDGRRGTPMFVIHGKKTHGRTLNSRGYVQNIDWLRAHVDPRAERVYPQGKHKYFYPLDAAMKTQLAQLARPYPKRSKVAGTQEPPESGRFESDPNAPA